MCGENCYRIYSSRSHQNVNRWVIVLVSYGSFGCNHLGVAINFCALNCH